MSKIHFQKRQKEMKRQEKQRMKAEKRAQRKMAKQAEPGTADQTQGHVLESNDEGPPGER